MEAKQRAKGTGSLYQRKSDMRWIGTIEHGYSATGARHRETVSAKTKAEARKKLDQLRMDIIRGEYEAKRATRAKTVAAWAKEWLEIKQLAVAPTTFNSYKGTVGRWIIPVLGHRRLADLTPADVRRFHAAQRDAGCAATSMVTYHSKLMACLKDAKREGYLINDRVFMVKAPHEGESRRRPIPTPKARRLLEAAADWPGGSRWVAAILQGLRQGEALGLRWQDIDFTQHTITIKYQLKPIPYRDRARGTFLMPDGYEAIHLYKSLHLVRPKTRASIRVAPLTPWLEAALIPWKEQAPGSPYDLVWPRPDGTPRRAAEDTADFRALQAAAGVSKGESMFYTPHEARNTTATLLLQARVAPIVIQAIMGHSDIETQQIYQQVDLGTSRQALGQVEHLLGR